MRVGLVGVGRMGSAMCARLVERGFAVSAWDARSAARADAVAAGARWAGSVERAVAGVDVVITSLPGPDEVSAVAASIVPGPLWIDVSTATPGVARRPRAVDAPVGGDPEAARAGRLVAFVGGSSEDVAAAREVLDALCSAVLHVGPAGAGYTVKLLVNLLWFGQAVAAAEALSVAARAGLDVEVVRRAVAASAAGSRFMESDAVALLRGDDLTSFSLAGCCDELSAVLALAGEHGVPMALGERVASLYADALAHYGDVDGELLAARLVAERAGVRWG